MRLLGSLALATTCFAQTPLAQALALGDLTVSSYLGQRLNAEIELLSLDEGDAEILIARLASRELFQQFNVARTDVLLDLRFAVDASDPGRPVVRISSNRPVNEPFVNVLMALESPDGVFLKEVSILLDPAVYAQQSSASPSVVNNANRSPTRNSSSNRLWVRRGDTLMSLGKSIAPAGVSAHQATVALYRNNPGAFHGSIHHLRPGVYLSVPSVAEMRAISTTEAKRLLRYSPSSNGSAATVRAAQSSNGRASSARTLPPATRATAANVPIAASTPVYAKPQDSMGEPPKDFMGEPPAVDITSEEDLSDYYANRDPNQASARASRPPPSVAATPKSDPSPVAGPTNATHITAPDAQMLLEVRGMIAELREALDGLEETVSEKVDQLEAIDQRVVLLQASLDEVGQKFSTDIAVVDSTVRSNIEDEKAIAEVSKATANSTAAAVAQLESAATSGAVKVDDIEDLAKVLLDERVIETARDDGTLQELVEEAKKRALDDAIDRGIVEEDDDLELVATPEESGVAPSIDTPNIDEPLQQAVPDEPIVRPDEMPQSFPANAKWLAEELVSDTPKAAELRKYLLLGALGFIVVGAGSIQYQRWKWRREVQLLEEEEALAEANVDTSNSLNHYRSQLDGDELQEETLKDALRNNSDAHDVRLQLLNFYAVKGWTEKYAKCARDMYRMTQGRVPEWQQVIEWGLQLDSNMKFYEAEDNTRDTEPKKSTYGSDGPTAHIGQRELEARNRSRGFDESGNMVVNSVMDSDVEKEANDGAVFAESEQDMGSFDEIAEAEAELARAEAALAAVEADTAEKGRADERASHADTAARSDLVSLAEQTQEETNVDTQDDVSANNDDSIDTAISVDNKMLVGSREIDSGIESEDIKPQDTELQVHYVEESLQDFLAKQLSPDEYSDASSVESLAANTETLDFDVGATVEPESGIGIGIGIERLKCQRC